MFLKGNKQFIEPIPGQIFLQLQSPVKEVKIDVQSSIVDHAVSLLELPDQVLLLTLRQEAGAGRVERLERERHKQDLNEDGLASVPKKSAF